jgi:1,2-diacylglycerol 3-beta-glucosyltransferase
MGILAAVVVALYPAGILLVVIGLRRLQRSVPRPDATCPTVSIVVSARNEIESLPRCVDALMALDYPRDRVDYVFVNDRSTDGTGDWLDAFGARTKGVTVLHTERLPANGLEAKARGIAHGMARATGEWILITDADAQVPRTWARHLMGRVDATTALVGGAGVVVPKHWWGRQERVTWAFLQSINFGAAGWGLPVVTIGPNMGIRRSVYEAAGGLERARFRIAEDLALFLMGRNAGGTVAAFADPETTVTLDEVPSPSHLVSQARRWVGGALEQGPAYSVGVPLALVWGVAVAVFFVIGWMRWPLVWAAFVVAKLAADTMLLSQLAGRMASPSLRADVLRVSVMQLWTMAWVPLSLVVTRRMQWRGANYAVKYE